MNEQARWWAGEAGNAYLARNRVNWRGRVPFWREVIEATKPNSVLEIGANAGWNLRAIREASPGTHVCGIDVNAQAVRAALEDDLPVYQREATDIRPGDRPFDIVFTAGVLIHVAPENLQAVMRSVIDRSDRYVLAVEYPAGREEAIEYRGQAGLLWKRPFGELYVDLGLTPVSIWPEAVGFDRCAAWLLEKP